MKYLNLLWTGVVVLVVAALACPTSHAAILHATRLHPYLMGFSKFALMASLGELLAIRIVSGRWSSPAGMPYRAFVWGVIGYCMALLFVVFAGGTDTAMRVGMLPGLRSQPVLIQAFWSSFLLNMLSGPVVMCCHRIADTALDMAGGSLRALCATPLRAVVARIDWPQLVEVVCLRVVIFFWIPAHTITFLLPSEYRLLYAAILSFTLGVILAFAKRRSVCGHASGFVAAGLPGQA